MIRLPLLLLLCLLPGLSAAAKLHKCLAADGLPSYQSEACPPGARTLWVRDALPEASPPRPTAQVPAHARSAPAASEPVRTKSVRTRQPSRDPKAMRCAKARRAAELKRNREWNRLDFRQRSELDASVARACAR